MSSNGKILDLPSVSSAELREPFADPTAVTVFGRAEREPALQDKDFLVATPELPKDNCRVLGVGGCRLSAVAVAFCSFNRCVSKDSVRGCPGDPVPGVDYAVFAAGISSYSAVFAWFRSYELPAPAQE